MNRTLGENMNDTNEVRETRGTATKVVLLAGAALAAGTAWLAVAQSGGESDRKIAELRAQAETLERTVRRLEDEHAIENLQRSYGFFIDKALWNEAADLFAEDGTLEIGGYGVFVGKARVREFLTSLAPRGLTRGLLFDHMQLQPVVTVAPDGRTAQGRWRSFAQVGVHGESGTWGLATYENEYVKENGVWKIKKLHAFRRMVTPYEDGWGKTALPNTTPKKELPPDRPPSVEYAPYPDPFSPPYHYSHPGAGG
ncbi:MAG: nuclear transport factor 2 family protein [Proteobacteria bacterium]|nr:MAG: nuclear transport factor 2 family protein [Pseudomonadota bacterium]